MRELDAILAALERLGRRTVLERLQPGLPPSRVSELLGAAGLRAPDTLTALYAWRNGTELRAGEPLDELHLFPGFAFLALEDALADRSRFSDDPRWSPSWLPVFGNGGGDSYAVDLASSDGRDAPVIGYLLGDPEQPVEYRSVAAMLATLAACFDNGAFFVDREGHFELDDDAHATLARRFNPDVAYWA